MPYSSLLSPPFNQTSAGGANPRADVLKRASVAGQHIHQQLNADPMLNECSVDGLLLIPAFFLIFQASAGGATAPTDLANKRSAACLSKFSQLKRLRKPGSANCTVLLLSHTLFLPRSQASAGGATAPADVADKRQSLDNAIS
jgi:hypothetical protein